MAQLVGRNLLGQNILYPWGPPLKVEAYNRTASDGILGDVLQFDTGLSEAAETDPIELVAVADYGGGLSSAFVNCILPVGTTTASKLTHGFFGCVSRAAPVFSPQTMTVLGEVTTIRVTFVDFATAGAITVTAGSPLQPQHNLRAADVRSDEATMGQIKVIGITKAARAWTSAAAVVLTTGAIMNGITGW